MSEAEFVKEKKEAEARLREMGQQHGFYAPPSVPVGYGGSAVPVWNPEEAQAAPVKKKPSARERLSSFLSGFQEDDLLILALFFLLFNESKEDDFLILVILAVLFFSS